MAVVETYVFVLINYEFDFGPVGNAIILRAEYVTGSVPNSLDRRFANGP
jgi:hypothetical protein